jgi:regulator of nonsense transcripts 1
MRVADDLKDYTCDAMFGKDLNQYPAVRRKAIGRISESKLVFTTCVGAALGLLRNRSFETVIIDEASQQTEPASLIPLVKGCQRAILVGDHVQLRATVSPHAAVVDFDVSLMERLWMGTPNQADDAIARVMLDTQYRMHSSLCQFLSAEFYGGRLLTTPGCDLTQLPPSRFPWPQPPPDVRGEPNRSRRAVFIQCNDPEDYGKKSKVNQSQANICKEVLQLLTTAPTLTQAAEVEHPGWQTPSISILTPYSRQVDLLKQLCGRFTVSSIDGFQGQEADIVIFVTVRCNLQGEIGFLKDMRRLNVALTRAKAGLIILGDQTTLTMKKEKEEACKVWDRLVQACTRVKLPARVPQR